MRGSVDLDRNSALAQLVEQLTVNQRVAGSSPAGGAKFSKVHTEEIGNTLYRTHRLHFLA